MGISLSCPFSKYIDTEASLESILVESIYFSNEEVKTLVRSVSFRHDKDSQPVIMKSTGNKMALEASVRFKTTDEDVRSPTSTESIVSETSNSKHDAAIKLQKVYKSFRTRRKLADCAVLVQHRWWEVLDYVELNNSSISFFDEGKHETANSRWSRARTRAAKVGKGLSKNDKGQKLALQHWLEAIDPRHRYGHNLHFYYAKWLHSQSREPFFYWLDVGEGKEVNLVDKCPRWKLQQQCIKYLGPIERKEYEVSLDGGKFFYKKTGEPLHTVGESGDVKWIFVLSTSKTMYVGRKKKGSFQHSSFLAGGAALAAGRLVIEHGILKAAWPHSGHYRPTAENFHDFIAFLRESGVDLTDVKLCPGEEEGSTFLRSSTSVEDLTQKFDSLETVIEISTKESIDTVEKDTNTDLESPKPSRIQRFGEKLTNLKIPERNESIQRFIGTENSDPDSPTGGYNDEFGSKEVLEEPHSLPVGNRFSGKWTTGAGARIKYVREYPTELQVRALEHVNLSPRSLTLSRSGFSPEREPYSDGSIGSRPKSWLSRSWF